METAEQTEAICFPISSRFTCYQLVLLKDGRRLRGILFLLYVQWTYHEYSYYYRSFSCFSEKIFSNALSFRMMLFPPREATTTAEPPEPFTFQHS